MSGGRDIYYSPVQRDITFIGNELSTMSDLENLRSQLYLRLLCEKGELRGYPEYGTNLYKLLSKALTPTRTQEIQREVTETLKQDARVIRVDTVQIVVSEDAVTISTTVYDVENRPVEILISEGI
ncbi:MULTISPECIES: DUF2634 domain-containing protein [unclassified Paenibacillus]|uniref:DUF2634 domain-containing protein n=1 Tax=unclassified Paenibacillus TaxID=185978 RepID=UPI003640B502